jgi:cob(I)alamin adenosyltransferase
VKPSFLAIITQSPVRRAAAFFAFLGFLTLASCGEDPDSPAAIMAEQTRVFNEMADLLNEVAEGADPMIAAEQLSLLGEELKSLKIKLSQTQDLREEGRDEIVGLADFQKATARRAEAFSHVLRSGKMTRELERAIMAHHNPAPMKGEGTTD